MTDTPEPTHDLTDRACLILELPELSDEAAWEFCEFFQRLAEHIDAHYWAQLRREYRARECERQRLYRERLHLEAQQALPFTDPPF